MNIVEEADQDIATKIIARAKFDPFHKPFLNLLTDQRQDFKIRIYILTCQNLAAVDSYVDFKSKLAGDQALCSADPFPVIKIGQGENDTVTKKVKLLNDREKALEKDLNP